MIHKEKDNAISFGDLSSRFTAYDATSRGKISSGYVSQEIGRIFDHVQFALLKKNVVSINNQVTTVLLQIMEMIKLLHDLKVDLSNIPAFNATYLEDGTFLMEWLSTNYRVGFVFDENPQDSIWYLVSKSESVDSNHSGSLSRDDMRKTINELVSYVASNS